MTKYVKTMTLSVADYAVLGAMLGLSAAVGIFFAYRDRKKKEPQNYHLANRKISWWSSGISCSLTILTGTTVIGGPAQIMYAGSAYAWTMLGLAMGNVIAAEVFLPVYYKNGMSGPNEYYGVRFGKHARYVAIAIYILQTIAYNGVMIYAPAVALSAVSDLSEMTAALSIGIVCTVYTSLGGLKAVIWTDVIQGALLTIMLGCILAGASNVVGGIGKCLYVAWEGGRTDFNHFEFDPRYQMTFWSMVFGLGTMWTSVIGTHQTVVQRFLCCRSIREGKKAMYAGLGVTFIIFIFLICILGYVTYAYFADCDPLANKAISARDQALPLLVQNVFSAYHGVTGLFIAGVFAAALSTVSSAIHGMSGVAVGDIVQPLTNLSEETIFWVSRGLTVVFGVLCIGFAYLASVLESLIYAALSFLGVFGGALLGPAVLGILFPVANEKGAIAGMLAALSFNVWLFLGAWSYPTPLEFWNLKRRNTDGCISDAGNVTADISEATHRVFTQEIPVLNSSAPLLLTWNLPAAERPPIAEFYAVSFGYYAPMGLMVCVVVGLTVSAATGGLRSRYEVDPTLIYLPFEHPTLRWLPKRFRQYMTPKMGACEQIPRHSGMHGNSVTDRLVKEAAAYDFADQSVEPEAGKDF